MTLTQTGLALIVADQLFRAQRAAKQIPLQMRDAPVNQPGRLVAGFPLFRHGFQVEFLCQQ
ncbi:hypothetical protein E05_23920 [Plautia stali symbiont]|nr:hypothetical protein E05_23920 [Plautia stali symbiont]